MRTFLLITLLFLAFAHGMAEAAFVDNGDTVTDTVTCLQWQKATMDTKNGAGPDTYTWQEALAVSEGLSLAGHADWRLPDKNELHSIVDYSRYNPAIDPVFAATTQPSHYWSSTTYAGSTGSAWLVYFGNGYDASDDKSSGYYVRAVRGGQCGGLGTWDLADAVRILQTLAGITPAAPVGTVSDVNNDQRLGLAEVIEVLNQLAQ